MWNMASGGSLGGGGCAKNATCFPKSDLLGAEFASSPKNTDRDAGMSKDCGVWMAAGILALCSDARGWLCVPVLRFKYSRGLFTVRVSMSVCVSTRCLGARGAGGALQGGLGEASGEGSDAGICQRGGRKQLVPAADCGREVQVLQEDLGHSHEALVVHTPVIPPHDNLRRR